MRENPCKHNDVRLSSEPSVSHGEIQLTTGARSGTLTVAGGVSTEPTSVTMKDNNNSPAAAMVYEGNLAWIADGLRMDCRHRVANCLQG
jgi:hypothetical protein